MAKRRFRQRDEGTAPEKLTPEERRAQRRREKAQERSGKFRRGFGSPLRRGLLIGIPVAAVAVVIAFFLFNPANLASPCLSLSSPSGDPYYPTAGTTNFNGTWCPPSAGTVLALEPLLKIVINGTVVPLPAGLGVNRSYGQHTCQLPIYTPVTAGTLPAGVFIIASPWDFSYNLTWFFEAWFVTYSTVKVDPAHATQPVQYTATNLLGYSADKTHKIQLFVDGQPSTAGGSLVLPTLPYSASPGTIPACIARTYGTGHTIELAYTYTAATAGIHGITAPVDATGPGNPQILPQLWDGPLPRLTPVVVAWLGAPMHATATLSFLLTRPIPVG